MVPETSEAHGTNRIWHWLRRRTFLVWAVATTLALSSTGVAASAPSAADPKQPQPAKEHINRASQAPMKQNYTGGLPVRQASLPVAADARRSGTLAGSAQPVQQPIEVALGTPLVAGEAVGQRTATSSLHRNGNGTLTRKEYFAPKFYKVGEDWRPVDTALVLDRNPHDVVSGKLARLEEVDGGPDRGFLTVAANEWQARFAPSDFPSGMVRLRLGASQVGFRPLGARSVAPVLSVGPDNKQRVVYPELWPGIDVEYSVYSAQLKEDIVLKHREAVHQVSFGMVGAALVRDGNGFSVQGALHDEFAVTPINLILSTFGVVSDTSVYHQDYRDGVLTVSVDRAYLRSLPAEAFPAVIDPGWYRSPFGNRAGGNYKSYKSDGYVCPPNVCNPYAGSVLDASYVWRNWRGTIHSPYGWFQDPNKRLVNATLHLTQRLGLSVSGTTDPKWFDVWHRTCDGYNCLGNWGGEAYIGTAGDINLTGLYQSFIAAGDWGAWLMITGEENVPWTTYKNWDPDNSYVDFTYYDPPSAPGIAVPLADQTFIDPQVSFRLNGVGNPNNGDPLEYELLVSSGRGGVGTVVSSGLINATQWTIPDGILQDGSTYYVQAHSYDNTGGGWGPWSASVPFKIDTRTGKDATQTFDTLGPVSVDLATGNLTTGLASHTSAALGGSLGVSLDYNSPVKSRPGLVGEYWNNGFGGSLALTRVDQNVDFNWDVGSPGAGVAADNFSVRWTGFFIPPVSGGYQFGSTNDDGFTVKINDQVVHTAGCCSGTSIYNGSPVTLQAGQPARITAEFTEGPGGARAQLWVKGAVAEGVVKKEMLQTGVRPADQSRGLTGRYFHDDGSHTFVESNLFMQRTDPLVSFDWSLGAPVPNGPGDNFLVRWNGYLTVPVTGNYELGSASDDGARVKINGTDEVQANWTDHGVIEGYGASRLFTAGQSVPITVEYFEHGGGAAVYLKIKSDSLALPAQIIPSTWLSPSARVLPAGWSLGIDPDGDLSYDRLSPRQNSAVLTDSTGSTHEYTWTGSSYKPPVNEDGQLIRNSDGTFTLQDVDGRTYVFTAEGLLASVTNPTDDRKPAALRYTYGGTPPRINQITDGVTSQRWAKVFYSGAAECGGAPSGFDASAPGGMLCAVQTNDNRSTYFYYLGGQLARMAEPGNELTDFQYEQLPNGSSRIVAIRDVAANDAIAAGVRSNDATVLTQIEYDILGRVSKVVQPAATTGANQLQHTVEYLGGATQQHIVGATEPHGFSRRVEYDNILRTTKDVDIANLADQTEWHAVKDLVLSTTDETGLKTTSHYDDNDRLVHSYGPAPAAWYDANRLPVAPYTAQTPHTETRYDEGIDGPAVAWYDAKNDTLYGAPKLHTTGTSPGTNRVAYDGTKPITPSVGSTGIGLRATGKITLPGSGSYTFYGNVSDLDDGYKLYIDGTLLMNKPYNNGGANRNQTATFTATGGKQYDFMLEYIDTSNNGYMSTFVQGPGLPVQASYVEFNHLVKPNYGLATSTKTYDTQLGDTVTATNYGPNPELGLVQSTTVDPGGLNLTTTMTYEPQGAEGSFLRQTSKTLPGGGTTTYAYYGAAETRDNPCTPTVEALKQAGSIKFKTEPDPDGPGTQTGRTTETVYDDAGRIVATRYNNDSWTCTTYDARGRVNQTVIPQRGNEPGRTITNNWSVGGNPLVTATGDNIADITTAVDLLGRVTSYADAHGDVTTSAYDNLGRLSGRSGPVGNETFVYDNYGRLVQQQLDGVTYAAAQYDQYSRLDSVDYPSAGGLRLGIGRDVLGRLNSHSFNGTTAGAPTLGPNLIANPSFETADPADPNTPNRWYPNNWGTNEPSFSYESGGHTGTHSVKTELASHTDGDAKWYFEPVPVTAGATYQFSDFYRSNTYTSFVVQFIHQDGGRSYHWLGGANAVSETWEQSAQRTFTVPTTVVAVTVFHLIELVGWLMVDDPELREVIPSSAGTAPIASDTVTRSQSGQILNDIVASGSNELWSNYGYDQADRLVSAEIGPHTYNYGFGSQDASCGTASGLNPYAGKNSNRTRQTVDGVTTYYCYDYADRLVSSSDTIHNGASYDSHGNLTRLGTGSTPLWPGYDASDRNWGFEQYDDNGNGVGLYYDRDVQGRIIGRYKNDIQDWNWQPAGDWFYTFTGSSDTPDIVRTAGWQIIEKNIALQGGVLLTIKPQESGQANRATYSLPNIHGDVLLTVNGLGVNTSTGNGPANSFTYDPFGSIITGSTFPSNTASGSAYGYLGQHQKLSETLFALAPIQMGARVYLPSLGRFAQIDPIEGGNANLYSYPADPVNEFDLTGEWPSFKSIVKAVTTVATIASFIPGPVGMVAAGVAVAGNLAQGNWKGAALAAGGAVFGAARLVTKATAIVRAAKATSRDGNAGFGALKANPLTARLAGKLYANGNNLMRFRIDKKSSGLRVANFEKFKKPPVSNRLSTWPNRTQNLHLRSGGWLW
jgi:RHS repeat-associated protein